MVLQHVRSCCSSSDIVHTAGGGGGERGGIFLTQNWCLQLVQSFWCPPGPTNSTNYGTDCCFYHRELQTLLICDQAREVFVLETVASPSEF